MVGDLGPPGRTPLRMLLGSANVYLSWVTGWAAMLRARRSKKEQGEVPSLGAP